MASPEAWKVLLMVLLLAMCLAVVFVLEEEVLVGAVSGKGDGGDAESGECVLESVVSGEWALGPPGVSARGVSPFSSRITNGS